MGHTAPWRAREYDDVLVACKSIDCVETVASQPKDLARDTVYFGIMLCAFHRLGVLLDGEDTLTTTGTC